MRKDVNLLLSALVLVGGAGAAHREATLTKTNVKDCFWFRPNTEDALTGWEFELITPLDRIVPDNRTATLNLVSKQLQALAAGDVKRQKLGFNISQNSLRTSLFHQVSHLLSTLDGHSLVDPSRSYPWRSKGFLRLRSKLGEERPFQPHGAGGSSPPEGAGALLKGQQQPLGFGPGYADLTLKLQGVDPATVPAFDRNMSGTVHPWGRGGRKSRLHVKVEEDSYCVRDDRANYEARYGPIPPDTDISTLAGVQRYFPELGEYLGLTVNDSLPLQRNRFFSKSVWDTRLQGVEGVANMNLDYTSREDLLAGTGAVSAELSFRLKRENIERVHKRDDAGYYDSLAAVGELCGLLFDLGWDEAAEQEALSSS